MKLLTALACTSLLLGGIALAQDQNTRAPSPQPQTPSAQTPSGPTARTPTATPAQTARTASAERRAHHQRTAQLDQQRVDRCMRQVRGRSLTGSARTRFLDTCEHPVASR